VASTWSFTLECSQKFNYDWAVGRFLTCISKNMNVTKPGEVMEPKPGSYDKVTGLFISFQAVYFIPRLTRAFARRLEALVINNCHLQSVEREDLAQFPKLLQLMLGSNDFKTLANDVFSGTTKLGVIGFHMVPFESIGRDTLTPLKDLKRAWFSLAGCIDFPEADTPRDMKMLIFEIRRNCSEQKVNN
jgi:hypothetical protein